MKMIEPPAPAPRSAPIEELDWPGVPDGPWFARPRRQQLLLLAFVRPLYALRGYVGAGRQAAALALPYFAYGAAHGHARAQAHPERLGSKLARLFEPMGWVHELPCTDPYPHSHDEIHGPSDHCLDSMNTPRGPHAITWERDLTLGQRLADTFDVRFGRYYTLIRPGDPPDPMESAETANAPSGAGDAKAPRCSDSTAGSLSEAPGGPGGQISGLVNLP